MWDENIYQFPKKPLVFLGMDKLFNPLICWECNYLSRSLLKIIRVNKSGPRCTSLLMWSMAWIFLRSAICRNFSAVLSFFKFMDARQTILCHYTPNTVRCRYNAVNFSLKSSQPTPHSSHVRSRARYGVCVVILKSDSLSATVITVPYVI